MNPHEEEHVATLAPPQASKALFLYTAVNRDGETVIERIEATNTTTARYALELRGYSSIVFHTDEWQDTFQQWAGQQVEIDNEAWTPEKELESRTSGGAWSHITFLFREFKFFWLPLAVWNTLSVLSGPPYGWISWLGFLLSGWFGVYFVWASLPGVVYQRLLYARVWAKWRAVYRWVAVLRFLQRFGAAPLPDMHLDACVAKALAAEGQIDEAVALLRKYENDESVPRSFYYSELGSVYDKGRLFKQATEYRARAVEASTGGAAEHIDYALGLILRLRDPQQARVALTAIADKETIDLATAYVSYCWGLIALEEGNYDEAKTRLLVAQQQAMPYAANVVMLEFFMEVKAHLVIVTAKSGDKQQAKQLFSEVKRFLIAHQEVDLYQCCEEALA
jgi:tetratricopeptide (TPR) repeat protein